MSVGDVVQHVQDVLGRAHALFGDSAAGGDLVGAGPRLAAAGDATRTAGQRFSALSGRLTATYGAFAADAGAALDGLAGADDRLGDRLRDAAMADRSGHRTSGAVVSAAATDTAAISPLTGTPAGQRALVTALRDRVSQQQRVVAAYRIRDARMAALLRALAYPRARGAGGTGLGTAFGATGAPMPTGGAGHTGLADAPWGTATGRGSGPGAVQVRSVADWVVPTGPGDRAVAAALGKRGRPYVWGAKGPNVFDCSGLTQWAWRQAGVQLGGDTYAQVRQGVAVPPDQVRAGDLIFPRSSFGEGGRAGPGHVMLAISATEVVHAPHSGDVVRVAPMPSGFVARRPVPPAAP